MIRLPSSGGIGPVNSFERSSSDLRLDRLPSSEGIGPVKLFLTISSSVTRPWASMVTPCHSSSGLSLNQFVLFVQFSPLVAL